MEFNVNHPIIFVMVGMLILAVLGQSVYFLVKALRRAKEKGMDGAVLKKTIFSSAVFTIAPAVAILVGVITLSKSLGIALPWLRLSIVGSLTYETVAAGTALTELGGGLGSQIENASDYVTVAFVMTVSIIIGLFLVPLLTKKIQGGMKKIEKRDKEWSEIFTNAMFLGMISAFLGYVFSDVGLLFHGDTSGLIPVCVMFVSAVVMVFCGVLSKKLNQRWVTDYALPVSLMCGMAAAIPITAWLG
ncbi:MAG: DUF5058 family protein [Lachnospiraceae bacterium]|jgi:hypothetical protein|nr:DUF5058 family protein [Lachnospiraceae bacterium]